MRLFTRPLFHISISLGIGILLGLLLPVGFVAGIEAIIIIILGFACCIKKR